MCDFYVTVKKTGAKSGMLFDAVAMDSSIQINQVHFNNNIEEYFTRWSSGQVSMNDSYMGPDFSTLDEVINEFLYV